MQATEFQRRILQYYQQYGRKHLPWQQNKTHYRVWVSEVMLQQTQVTTVIPYYLSFMERFPDLAALATANQDDVLAQWTGLGYYSRARNLHKCAQQVHFELNGKWPSNVEALEQLPGIGRSTAGAIHSLVTGQPATILDGNVKRVLCRFYAIEGWPGKPKVHKALWELADKLTPAQQVDHYNQAMMDLGATLCTRSKPQCDGCPVQSGCAAFAAGTQKNYPTSKPKTNKPERSAIFIVAQYKQQILLEKRPEQGIWGGLWSLPQAEMDTSDDALASCLGMPLPPVTIQPLPAFRHTFSHFHLYIHPRKLVLSKKPRGVMDSDRWQWQDRSQLDALGMPGPIIQLLKNMEPAT